MSQTTLRLMITNNNKKLFLNLNKNYLYVTKKLYTG